MTMAKYSLVLRTIPSLIAICSVGVSARAETGRYIFVSEQSTLIQTGGIAGIHRTYTITGTFQLTADFETSTALFAQVDASAVCSIPSRTGNTQHYNLDPNEVFNMTSLVGVIMDGGESIRFDGTADDGSSIQITLTLAGGNVFLKGETFPPPGSADFFIYTLDALAIPKYEYGHGTADDPYRIYTAADLIALSENPDDYDKHFIVAADIDMDPNLPGRKVFDKAVIAPHLNPGDSGTFFEGTPFNGVLDGNDYTISHLTITGENYLGLFGRLESEAKISNLGLEAVRVSGTGSYVGGLVGRNWLGSISTSYSTGTVTGESSVGGLVGSNSGSITTSYSTGTVSGGWTVGGFTGWNSGSIITSYSNAKITGDGCVGGLVGRNAGGGDLGQGIITTSYSTGAVTGNTEVGGLVGRFEGGSITVSFWDMETSGQLRSAGGTGLTTAEMRREVTFLDAGWDFMDEIENGTEDIWWILEGQSYPRLWWQYGRAFSPYPHDGTVDVTQPLILTWLPGGSNLFHEIYFGDDIKAVINATTESTEIYRGRQAPEITTYDPGLLELGKTYYWRVDEVESQDNTRTGSLWSFRTANFLVVDDFESYTDNDWAGETVWQTWIDGFGIPENGSIVGCMWPMWPCPEIVHGGWQSLPYYYNHSGTAYYSEATANTAGLVIGRDWTREGVGVLSLWFYGDPANAPEEMYAALANTNGPTATVYHDDPNATLIDTWTQWNIPLTQFSDQGVVLSSVETISIGFGDKTDPQPREEGQVYFDDIRLYRP